jgi:hypothetical protein
MRHVVVAVATFLLGTTVAASANAGAPGPPPAASEPSLSFRYDIIPVLNKTGCNSGTCHGIASGQNGFKLSLFGFDPESDYAAIVEEGLGRRVSQAAPDTSMLLVKATARAPHGGGQRFTLDSGPYKLLRKWISDGTPWGSDREPEFVGLQVAPTERVLGPKGTLPLQVTARYADGRTRDLTDTAEYFSQRPTFLQVDERGTVRALGERGEWNVMVRHLGAVASTRITVPHRSDLPETAYADFQPRGFIDELALKKWRQLGIAPSSAATDAEFLRRATLDVTGAIPSPKEVREFLADTAADKCDRLVDRLLQSDRYAVFWASKWGDLLRNKQANGLQEALVKFADWIRGALAKNLPYDQFARELVTVTGERSKHPQIDWYRQLYTPQTRVEYVSQIFLGLRVSCANCHNHPFERTSQNDYWQFAAFFARLEAPGYGAVDKLGIKNEGDVTNPRTGKPSSRRGSAVPSTTTSKVPTRASSWLSG